MVERTFVMLKPGGLQRRILGEILSRFERKGLKITALKLLRPDRALAEAHYAEHRGKDFYEPLIEYTLSGPVAAMVLEGENAVKQVRLLTGPTDANEAPPGTIRGDFAVRINHNVIHASDSVESAGREIALFFTPGEVCPWEDLNSPWL